MGKGKDKKRTIIFFSILALVAIMAITVIVMQLRPRVDTGSSSAYPPSTLSDEKGFTSYQRSQELPREMSCPTIPYTIDVPETLDTSSSNVIVGITGSGLRVALQEIAPVTGTQDALYQEIATAGASFAQVPDLAWHPVMEDTGYLNGYRAEYGSGYMILGQKVSNIYQFVVYYRISPEYGDNDLLIYAYADSLDRIMEVKGLADAEVYTLHAEDGITQDTEEENVSMLQDDGRASNQEDYSEDDAARELADFIESMDVNLEATRETIEGSWPLYSDPDDLAIDGKSVPLEDVEGYYYWMQDYDFAVSAGDDALFVFMWDKDYNNATPTCVTITDPNGIHYENYDEATTSISNGLITIRVPETEDGSYYLHYVTVSDLANPDVYYLHYDDYVKRLEDYDNDYTLLRSDIFNHRYEP